MENKAALLFQGDSITDGNRGRSDDPNHILGHGYASMVSARLGADNLEARPQFINRGQSGDGILDIYARWRRDAILLRPTAISLLAGINDTSMYAPYDGAGRGMPRERYERIYRMILDDTLEIIPGARFVLMEPFYLPDKIGEREKRVAEEIAGYQASVLRLSLEYGCAFVPLQEMFNSLSSRVERKYLIWDGVHPTMTGHEFIARQWLSRAKEKKII